MVPTLIPSDDIRVLHLELTTRCQASCPQCARMDPTMGYSKDHDLSLEQVQQLFPVQFVQQLDKMFACGNFGDPAAARDCIAIFRWFRQVNPGIVLGMHTNGGLRDTKFWIDLGQLLNQELDYCVFSIDGMASSNDIYRRGVMWHRVILNAEAFIKNGGRAHWDMLVFEHNQHHIDHCREHARKLGFVRFRTKVSSRFEERPIEFLAPPSGHVARTHNGPIVCHAKQERSIYVAATGEILPCCFIGSEVFRMDQRLRHLCANPTELETSWTQDPHEVCTRFCATADSQTRFQNQFDEDTALC